MSRPLKPNNSFMYGFIRFLIVSAISIIYPQTASAADVVTVSFQTQVSTYSWYPLPLATISKVVEGRVLQIVTRSGKLTLLPEAAGKPADLTLKVSARIIEDAGQFSVFISAIPRLQDRTGSMAAVATQPITGRDHKGIQGQIERTADEAARKLDALMGPRLHLLAGTQDPARILPMGDGQEGNDFASEFKLSGLSGGGGSFSDLQVRAEKEKGARMALAHCASGAGKAADRVRCIDALAQLARRHPSAQRALIAVLFQPPPARGSDGGWEQARLRAFRITTSFEGPALDEAVQAWLYLLASDYSDQYHVFGGRREDYQIMETVAEYLAQRPHVPNLDRALALCSRPSRKGNPPDGYCLKVMKSVPVGRRLALLWTQLSAPPAYSHQEPWRAWVDMLETVADRKAPLHPAVEELCKQRILRSFWKRDRMDCLEALGRQGKPTAALTAYLSQVLRSSDSDIFMKADDALAEVVKRAPAQCPVLEKTLGPAVARGAIPIYYAGHAVPRALAACRKKSSP